MGIRYFAGQLFTKNDSKSKEVKENAEKQKQFLQDIGDRLKSKECKSRAIVKLEELLQADELVGVEENFLSQVRIALL